MKDEFGREISYMRVSITEKCNLQCLYCRSGQMPARDVEQGLTELTIDEIEEVVQKAVSCGITKFRITGGEPLMRPDVVEIVRRIRGIEGVKELTLTTNGTLLKRYAHSLKEAGISRINISLDTLDADKYHKITKWGNIKDVWEGINAAKEVGLLPIKINVVLLKDFNRDEIEAFVELTKNQALEVRFIEWMPMGPDTKQKANRYLSGEGVLRRIPKLQPIEESGVAKRYQLPDGQGSIGLIRSVSSHFCMQCNRIRLTGDGKLKPCLHREEEIDIRYLHGLELKQAIEQAILRKPMMHPDFDNGADSCSNRDMYRIGG